MALVITDIDLKTGVMSGGSSAKLIWSDKWSRLAIRSNLPELLKAERTLRCHVLFICFYAVFFFFQIKKNPLGYSVVLQTVLLECKQ